MKEHDFVGRFESLRGIAALMVALCHSLAFIPLWEANLAVRTILGYIGNGRAAVTLFFVLSGFVLGKAIQRAGGNFTNDFLCYAIRRCFRIYPAFLCLTLLILAWLCSGARLFPGICHWLDHPFMGWETSTLRTGFPGLKLTLQNLFFLDSSLNPVTWTLKVEMGCSLALPIFHSFSKRLAFGGKLIFLLGLLCLAALGKWFVLFGLPQTKAIFDQTILRYLYLFYLGYLLPEGRTLFSNFRERPCWNGIVGFLALVLFLPGSHDWVIWNDDLRILQGLGAWLILGMILYGTQFRFFRLLDHPLIIFYGKISYSFYLLHDLVLVVALRFSAVYIPLEFWVKFPVATALALWVISTGAATGLAWIFHGGIEKPFIRLSKKICTRISAARPTPRVAGRFEGAEAVN
jgi:peptidoglycan/LPS O-acetylase OafA/YrhL